LAVSTQWPVAGPLDQAEPLLAVRRLAAATLERASRGGSGVPQRTAQKQGDMEKKETDTIKTLDDKQLITVNAKGQKTEFKRVK
jgi:hypothetical protein